MRRLLSATDLPPSLSNKLVRRSGRTRKAIGRYEICQKHQFRYKCSGMNFHTQYITIVAGSTELARPLFFSSCTALKSHPNTNAPMMSNPRYVLISAAFHFWPHPVVIGLMVSQKRSITLMIRDSFAFNDSAENTGLTHRLFTAWNSRSVSVKLLYVPAAISKVLYHSPFLTLADRGPYIVLRADAVLKDNAFGAMRTTGPCYRQNMRKDESL
jgi:hypothetical protein